MAWTLDARIPLTLVADPTALAVALATGKPAAVLAEAPAGPLLPGTVTQVSFDPAISHAPACTCCNGRSFAAEALDRLFQARVRGQCRWFDRVLAWVATPAAAAAVTAALRDDALTAARFRLVPGANERSSLSE